MSTESPESQASLITRADSGDRYATPPLATSSYWEYKRGMGTAVRITRGAPRGALSRWTDKPKWPTVACLAPSASIFRQGLSPEEFRERYMAELDATGPDRICAQLNAIDDEAGQLVLLCFESCSQVIANPWVCHRRIFAQWWAGLTGRDVPELT